MPAVCNGRRLFSMVNLGLRLAADTIWGLGKETQPPAEVGVFASLVN